MATCRRADEAAVDLFWLPLGAGGPPVVRWSGRLFEAAVARHEHRTPLDLYHSALEVSLGLDRYVIETTPVWGNGSCDRGVVAEGPVGLPLLGRSRFFRYEVRRWRYGVIPDAAHAVAVLPIPTDAGRCLRLLTLVPEVPTLTWGLDELGAGDMWNSNSLVSWLLAASGHGVGRIGLPTNGRAPGWAAGLVAAGADPGEQPSGPTIIPVSSHRGRPSSW